jgi:hypothetical protein
MLLINGDFYLQKDDDGAHDREPLLQREGSHGSLDDIRPIDQHSDQPAIPIEQQHIDLVNNQPLSNQSPSKSRVYLQKRSRSPNKREGLGFENPQASESHGQLGASDRDDITPPPTDVKSDIPNVLETSAFLHNLDQGPLISPLIPQPNENLLADPILDGSPNNGTRQGDSMFSPWVSAEDDSIGTLNKERSSVLLALQNTSTSPPGFGTSSSPSRLNPIDSSGDVKAIPLNIPTVANETSPVPTIDWSGNTRPQQPASTGGQFNRDTDYGLLTSATPVVSQGTATTSLELGATISGSTGEPNIPSTVVDHLTLSSQVPSIVSNQTNRQDHQGKLLEEEPTITKNDAAGDADSNGQTQLMQELNVPSKFKDVQTEAMDQLQQTSPPNIKPDMGLITDIERPSIVPGLQSATEPRDPDVKADDADVIETPPIVGDNTQTAEVTPLGAKPVSPPDTTIQIVDGSQPSEIGADLSKLPLSKEKDHIPVGNAKKKNKEKKKGKKATASSRSDREDTPDQTKEPSSSTLDVHGTAANVKPDVNNSAMEVNIGGSGPLHEVAQMENTNEVTVNLDAPESKDAHPTHGLQPDQYMEPDIRTNTDAKEDDNVITRDLPTVSPPDVGQKTISENAATLNGNTDAVSPESESEDPKNATDTSNGHGAETAIEQNRETSIDTEDAKATNANMAGAPGAEPLEKRGAEFGSVDMNGKLDYFLGDLLEHTKCMCHGNLNTCNL